MHAHDLLGGVTGVNAPTAIIVLVLLTLVGLILRKVLSIWFDFRVDLAKAKAANALAEAKLASVGYETPMVVGVSNGNFDNGFSWRLEVLPDPDHPWKEMKRVRITVTWDGKRRPESLTRQASKFVTRKQPSRRDDQQPELQQQNWKPISKGERQGGAADWEADKR